MLLGKPRDWLQAESVRWVEDGLLSRAQAQAILDRYPAERGDGLARGVFTTIGAVLVGLGVILFFAWNWDALHRGAKLALLFGALLAAHAGGQWWTRAGSTRPLLGDGLAVLGTLLFGAGLWLISQVYHIDEHAPNAFLAWGVAALAMAWAMPSRAQGLLAGVLLASWGLMEAFEFRDPRWLAPLLLATIVALALRLRSLALLLPAVAATLLLLAVQWAYLLDRPGFGLLQAAGVLCLGLAVLLARSGTPSLVRLRSGLAVPGFALVLSLVFALSFPPHGNDVPDWLFGGGLARALWIWLPAVVAAAVALLAALPQPRLQPIDPLDAAQLLLAGAAMLLLHTFALANPPLPLALLSIAMNLAFLGHALLLVVAGSRAQRGGVVAIGCVLVAALVFARYNDLFDSLLARSVAFVLLGAGLFAVGHLYARGRRHGAAA